MRGSARSAAGVALSPAIDRGRVAGDEPHHAEGDEADDQQDGSAPQGAAERGGSRVSLAPGEDRGEGVRETAHPTLVPAGEG